MQPEPLEIRPDIRAGLHDLAEKTHRAEVDMLNEALALFLDRERLAMTRPQSGSAPSIQALIDRIKNRRASRDLGDFDLRAALEEGRD